MESLPANTARKQGVAIYVSTLLVVLGVLSFSLSRGFDVSDEGYYLYNHIWGGIEYTGVAGHVFFHPIGEIFGHRLLGYRFLTLFLILSSSAALAFASFRFLYGFSGVSQARQLVAFGSLPLLLSLFYYTNTQPGPSSDVHGLFFINIALSLLLIALDVTAQRRKLLLFAGAAIVINALILSRAPSGVGAFLVLLVAWAGARALGASCARNLALCLTFTAILFASIFLLVPDFMLQLYSNLARVSETSHALSVMIRNYKWDLLLFAVDGLLPVILGGALVWLVWRRGENGDRFRLTPIAVHMAIALTALSLLLPFLIIHYFDLTWSIFTRNMSANPILAIALVATLLRVIAGLKLARRDHRGSRREWLKHWLDTDRKSILSILALLAMVLTSIGTAGSLTSKMTFNLSPAGVILSILVLDAVGFVRSSAASFFPVANVVLAAISLTYVVQGRYLNPYRTAPFQEQTATVTQSSYLGGIKVSQDLAKTIDGFIGELGQRGFVRGRDRVIVLNGMPGFLSAAGVRSWGPSWVRARRKVEAAAECNALERDKLKTGARIFILHSGLTSAGLLECLKRLIWRSPRFPAETASLGTLVTHPGGERQQLELAGPFFPVSRAPTD